MKQVLVIGRGLTLFDGAGHHALGFVENEAAIARRGIRLEVRHALQTEELIREASAFRGDVIFLHFHWRERTERIVEALQEIRSRQTAKLVFVDHIDQTCSPYWPVLPYVDRYVKKQLLTPISDYLKPYRGGYVFTDYLENSLKIDTKQWHFSSPFPPEMADKVDLSWNLCAIRRYQRLALYGRFAPPLRFRPIDVNARFSLGFQKDFSTYYTDYRRIPFHKVSAMKGISRSGNGRLGHRRYLLEMALSKIAVSPFGWGEVCFRDFEAAGCRTLLLKPKMEHLKTEPDIFKPFETYVPLEWDFSDLEEKVRHYLANPDEAQRIAGRAHAALLDYFASERLADRVEAIVRGALGAQ